MGSPISSWEGAAAYFTGADSMFAIGFWLVVAAIVTVVPIIDTARHEAHAYRKHK